MELRVKHDWLTKKKLVKSESPLDGVAFELEFSSDRAHMVLGLWFHLVSFSSLCSCSEENTPLDLDDHGGRTFLRVLLHLTMHDYPPLVSGALQLLFRHFSQRQEVLQAFKQVLPGPAWPLGISVAIGCQALCAMKGLRVSLCLSVSFCLSLCMCVGGVCECVCVF